MKVQLLFSGSFLLLPYLHNPPSHAPPSDGSSPGVSEPSIFRYYHFPPLSFLLKLSSFSLVPPLSISGCF